MLFSSRCLCFINVVATNNLRILNQQSTFNCTCTIIYPVVSVTMSIKSQKSLNEECSEIFEKSYSVRSASNESLSCEDEDESLAVELMGKMTPAVLSKLRRCFQKAKEKNHDGDIDRRVEEVMRAAAAEEGIEFAAPALAGASATASATRDALWLHERGFVAALENIFEGRKYTAHARQLFQLLDPLGRGRVRWRQLVARLAAAGARRTRSRAEGWAPAGAGAPLRLGHCQRETIVKMVDIERADSFCYAAVSKGGRVGIYSGDLALLKSYEVFYHRTGVRRRVKNCWITDAIYLSDVQFLLLSASDRSLTVYDASTVNHSPLYCITGLPNIPTCLAYSPSMVSGGSSELVFGTERGDLIRLKFHQPRVSLFPTKSGEHINYYFWMELSSAPHSSYCSASTWRRVHSRTVRRVCYMRDGDIIMSCSHDSTVSVRARHAPGKLQDYVFKVQRGVTCFHAVSSLHLLVTGSCDGVVRLWESTQPAPFASLASPGAAAVLDVVCIAAKEIVLAFCSNCWVHIWDLYEECLLQTIRIKFPFLGVLGKKVEFGTYCIHPGPACQKATDDEPSAVPPESVTRRPSCVYQGSTGGLVLQPEATPDTWQTRGMEQELEYIRFARPEVVVSCCDYTCRILLRTSPAPAPAPAPPGPGPPLPPPADTLRARLPRGWDLPHYGLASSLPPQPPPPPPPPRAGSPPPPAHTLAPPPPLPPAPPVADESSLELDQLLENAGLQGILEKDFVLMQGLKYDLNQKLAEMESDMDAMMSAVNAGAPHLALRTRHEPALAPARDSTQEHRHVMRLFPGPSVAVTPTGSETSTPRKSKGSK